MQTIALASENPVKARAALRGFERMFPGRRFRVVEAPAASGVRDQPMSSAETLRGAHNRARGAAEVRPEADFWVGIEGGVEESGGALEAFAWIVVRSAERVGCSRSATFYLPEEVARRVRGGEELGLADDAVFGRSGSKQEGGAVGILTGDAIDRCELYAHAVVLALVPFKNPELYPPTGS